ncbi:MAG: LPS export ABC transporter ATP-binding protein [bacterium]|nr:LPS export ABC transporter ATP-binding protein [bacterium]
MSILKTTDLVKNYGPKRVVNEVSIEVNQGEIVGLLGPNGAGKTTTFYITVGLISPDAGKVWLDNEEITGLPMYKRARKGIGYLSQEPSVFRGLTVEENILAILETIKMNPAQRQARLKELLEELGIAHLSKQKANILSGGERRRCEIARSLVTCPDFMLLDEPFVGIDPIAVDDIQGIVLKLKEKGLGVLITDHNVRETLEITDRAYIMYKGEILLSGTSKDLVNDPKAREIYLGENFTMGL